MLQSSACTLASWIMCAVTLFQAAAVVHNRGLRKNNNLKNATAILQQVSSFHRVFMSVPDRVCVIIRELVDMRQKASRPRRPATHQPTSRTNSYQLVEGCMLCNTTKRPLSNATLGPLSNPTRRPFSSPRLQHRLRAPDNPSNPSPGPTRRLLAKAAPAPHGDTPPNPRDHRAPHGRRSEGERIRGRAACRQSKRSRNQRLSGKPAAAACVPHAAAARA